MKKKKNGFTLIEIIGAIIILGIIAIIAFVTYTKSLKGFREDYYIRETKTMAKAGEEFFNDNRNYRPTKVLNAQKVQLDTLETKKYITKLSDYNGDSCDESSYVMVVKEGANTYSYHSCLVCSKDGYDNTQEDMYCDSSWLDPTKVTYGIGTMETAYIYKGTSKEVLREELELPISYIRVNDSGKKIAERRGTKEGNETIFPVNIDAVDIDTIGTYKVIYEYGTEKAEREVVVYENLAPTIAYTKDETVATNLSGTTSTTTKAYQSGDWAQNIIVTLSSKNYVNGSIGTSEFQWNVDGRWQNFCSTDPCVKKITRELNQTVQFRVLDTNGHTSLLTEPVLMKIDNTKPTCTLNITTAIGNNDWYNSNVDITFSEKIDQKTSNDNTIVSGVAKYNIQKSSETLDTTTNTDSKSHTSDTNGITYKGYVEDEAKNFNTCSITFKRDATKPTCTSDGDSTEWITTKRTISYGCNDTRSGCDTNYSGGSITFDYTVKTSEIAAYTIKDNAGNSKSCPKRDADVYVGIPTTCAAGKYLNKLAGCATCTAGYYCPGGKYNPDDTIKGRTACPSGQTSEAGASSCHATCSQTTKEAICGGYCKDSEITYYDSPSHTVTTASSWVYTDPKVSKTIPEGKCIIKTDPDGQKCYVFQHFHVCNTAVTTNIAASTWYSQWENSGGVENGNNRIYVRAHFMYKGDPHCACYFAKAKKAKCS